MPTTISQRQRFATRAGALAASVVFAGLASQAIADDLFAVAGVTVEIEAESAHAAQERAVVDATVRATGSMLRKLTRPVDHGRLPQPDAATAAALVRGYEVTNERRAAQRYIGEFTIRFDADGVRALLRDAEILYADTRTPPVLVLPILAGRDGAALWDSPNPWRDAWTRLDRRHRMVDFVLPLGELEDLIGISAEQAMAGDEERLGAMAERYRAAGVLVVAARPGAGQESLAVEVRPHGALAGAALRRTLPNDGEPWRHAAETTAGLIEQSWLTANLTDYRRSASLDAIAELDGLESWLALRRGFAALSRIDRVEIHSLSVAQAALTLHYLGAEERLRTALAARGIDLVAGEGGVGRFLRQTRPRAGDGQEAAFSSSASEPEAVAPQEPRSPLDDLLVE